MIDEDRVHDSMISWPQRLRILEYLTDLDCLVAATLMIYFGAPGVSRIGIRTSPWFKTARLDHGTGDDGVWKATDFRP